MKQLCSTSLARMVSCTGRPAGTYRSSLVAPVGYLKFHAHFCAVTCTT